MSGEAYGSSCTTYGLEADAKLGALLSAAAGPLAIIVAKVLKVGVASKDYQSMMNAANLEKTMAAKGLTLGWKYFVHNIQRPETRDKISAITPVIDLFENKFWQAMFLDCPGNARYGNPMGLYLRGVAWTIPLK